MNVSDMFNIDTISTIAVVKYLSDLLMKGVFAGIGKDIWEKVKGEAKTTTESKAIAEFEKSPNDEKNINKIDLLLELWLENDKDFKEDLTNLLRKVKSTESTQINDSKNIINNSTISVNKGSIRIGDNNKV